MEVKAGCFLQNNLKYEQKWMVQGEYKAKDPEERSQSCILISRMVTPAVEIVRVLMVLTLARAV